ncbi:U-box domain-containing protein 44-like [Actinidia eriantha]|uniref:U-box domain-containing protein 44-like n=1 Tax=Actinidia eriantha TaxID=165200 RepID=UPI002585F9BA|nr:U-box domain-containing protein 44-like [Actinidia eriantha]
MKSTSSAVSSIHRSLSEICTSAGEDRWENSRRFSGYANRFQLVLNQLLRPSPPENLPPSVQTSLKGTSVDLAKAAETMSVYRNKSKIFVLINCQSLCASLHERTVAIGGWLALLDSSLHDAPDLRKKVIDLSRDMKQAQFRVTENEARVYCTLQKEGQGRQTSKAVQSAIIMDLARALGIESSNHSELSKQVKHLKSDLAQSNSISERRILISLEKIVDNWSLHPDISSQQLYLDFEDDAQISPFKNFLCPLTKEVMKSPVVLESSSQTYERSAIEYWFNRCVEDGRDPTCPVTGQVLTSLNMKPNIGLAGAIEEWINRNVEIQIKSAVQSLSEDSPLADCVEQVLDNIYKISEEHPSIRYKVRNAGVVVLIVKVLKDSSKSIGSQLRSKALMALLSMARDEESKKIMLAEGITRLAIHSLIGSSEKEKEYGVKLLLEFSSDKAYRAKVASEKGALVLLSGMAGDLEHPALSNLAEEVLKQMETVEDNLQLLAAAGRFEPLLSRLREGPDDVKIEMASLLGSMTLTNSSKEQIARQSGTILVELLSKREGRAPSLEALYNLSSLDDNATILVDSAVLPALVDALFENQDSAQQVKALAASIIANIVSKPGRWELASVDKDGNSMQSEAIVSGFLGLLSCSAPQCQVAILKILHGMASSPQATESVAAHIKSGDGLKTIITFLEHPEVEHRIYAFKLTRVLSERFCEDLACELKPSNKLPLFREKLLDNQSTDGERSDAACILANLPLSEDDLKTVLGANFVKWTVTTLKDKCCGSNDRISRPISSMVEGLLGLLLPFTRSSDLQIVNVIKDHRLMSIFREQLMFSSNPKVKQLAALGLKYLSESGRALAASGDSEPQPPHGFCSSLVFMCGRSSPRRSTCPIHDSLCEDGNQFCLLKSNCIKPLADLLSDEDTSVQIAAVEALSTLLLDSTSSTCFKRGVDELEQLGVVHAVILLFTDSRPGELQEKAIWMVARLLRAESLVPNISLNQSLVRALVEALKHGSAVTKRHAQEALTNLKQISGVSGKASSQTLTRR